MLNLRQAINLTKKAIEKEVARRLDEVLQHEALPKTPDNLIKWTTTVRKIKGEAFSFKHREYLEKINSRREV